MFLTRPDYDRGVNTFSPEGRLLQVEYAIEATKLGPIAIGICTSEGVVLAAEKRITSPLMEPRSMEKIVQVDKHIGCATTGFVADSRPLIDRARHECVNHWFAYNEKMSVQSCAQTVSDLASQFGNSGDATGAMSRPYAIAMLIAGVDGKGPQLYHTDSSGNFAQLKAKAVGAGSEGADQSLREVYNEKMSLKAAVSAVLTIIKQVTEEKLTSTNVEVMTMTPDRLYHLFTKEEVEKSLEQAVVLVPQECIASTSVVSPLVLS